MAEPARKATRAMGTNLNNMRGNYDYVRVLCTDEDGQWKTQANKNERLEENGATIADRIEEEERMKEGGEA